LIVDDEPHLARTLQILLADEHDVEVLTSGASARSVLEADTRFDAILCDLSMRDVSGMELFEWLSGRVPDVARRMIFMTGGAYTPQARAFLDRVPNPRVEKPFQLEELQALVRATAASRG
jgi:DNA-binding NtrC family response regulator